MTAALTQVSQWLATLFSDADSAVALGTLGSVAIVAWTVGSIVRQFGHRPSFYLTSAMNFAQLAFMGALAALFATESGSQIGAAFFLLQSVYIAAYAVIAHRRRRSAEIRPRVALPAIINVERPRLGHRVADPC